MPVSTDVAVVAVGAAERIAILAAPLALLDLGEVLAVARPALAHLLGHVAHALLQIVERAALRARGLARIATTQRLLGLTHRALGAAQRLGHRHAVLVELLHEVAELAAQAFLLAALLSPHCPSPPCWPWPGCPLALLPC